MLTIDNFDTQFAKMEVQKGRHYFERKAVLYAEQDSKGVWQAEVESTGTYSVWITFDKKEVADTQCDCPVEGPYCNHVIAVLFAIREALKMPKPKPGREPKTLTIEGLLAKLTANEMRAFLTQVATFKLSKEVDKVIGAGQELLTKGNFRDAITVGKVVATEMAEVVKTCDDSAGNISGCVSEAIALLNDAAESDDMAPWAEVLKLLQASPTYDRIEQLHPHLAPLYPAEMLALYVPILSNWGQKVSTRPEYKQLATAIKKVKKELAGSDAAMDKLVNTLRANNPRKPAFLEELNDIYREPKKRAN